jgi:hypothetical protein
VFDVDGIYTPEVLDITGNCTPNSRTVSATLLSVCLQTGYPTVASVPHSIINGYKKFFALSVETDCTYPLAEKVKAFLTAPLLLPSQPRLKSRRSRTRVWDLISLINHQKAAISALFAKQGNKGLLSPKQKQLLLVLGYPRSQGCTTGQARRTTVRRVTSPFRKKLRMNWADNILVQCSQTPLATGRPLKWAGKAIILGWVQGLIPVIPATLEVEIGSIMVLSQPRLKARETPSHPTSCVCARWSVSVIPAMQNGR